jgi:Ca-activated chloride channel family protein
MIYTTIPVDIDNDALQKIADIGEGKFFRAADYETLKHVYQEINKLETSQVAVKHFYKVSEYFTAALYPGLLFSALKSPWPTPVGGGSHDLRTLE